MIKQLFPDFYNKLLISTKSKNSNKYINETSSINSKYNNISNYYSINDDSKKKNFSFNFKKNILNKNIYKHKKRTIINYYPLSKKHESNNIPLEKEKELELGINGFDNNNINNLSHLNYNLNEENNEIGKLQNYNTNYKVKKIKNNLLDINKNIINNMPKNLFKENSLISKNKSEYQNNKIEDEIYKNNYQINSIKQNNNNYKDIIIHNNFKINSKKYKNNNKKVCSNNENYTFKDENILYLNPKKEIKKNKYRKNKNYSNIRIQENEEDKDFLKNEIKKYKNKIKKNNEEIEQLKKEINILQTKIRQNEFKFKNEEKKLFKTFYDFLKIKNINLEFEFNDILDKANIFEQENELKEIIEDIKKTKKELNKEPLILYKNPTLIGLNNDDEMCFMNSILQCLSQTKELTNYFLKKENKDLLINNNISKTNENEYQLSLAYFELIKNLWDINGNESYYPNNFINVIKNINPSILIEKANDLKDCIIFIIEQLHNELKMSNNLIQINNSNNSNESFNQYDINKCFKYCFNEFNEEKSVISNIFFGLKEIKNECLNCKNDNNLQGLSNNPICYNYEMFNYLVFPLQEVYNSKNNSNQNNDNNQYYNIIQSSNKYISLKDCFNYFQRNEIFDGDNQNYCNICKKLSDFSYSSKIFISPNVLILILNRENDNINNIKLEFTESIDITEFVYSKDIPLIIYDLYGVISDIGSNTSDFHFIASCKSPINKKWYRYDDSSVISITNFENEIMDFGTPYILFYQKKNNINKLNK